MNFQTLVVAGLGSIGGSMFAVGKEYLRWFAKRVAVDREPMRPLLPQGAEVELLVGDITDPQFLNRLLRSVPVPALLLNLCSSVDNLVLRKMLAGLPIGYLDSGCCTPDGTDEYRFSRMMPYTLTPVDSVYPHWVCWGINPGTVEIVTRMLLRDMGLSAADAKVTIFEHDGLYAEDPANPAAVGWCPTLLVEEMLISPSLVVEGGRLLEGARPGGMAAWACWGDDRIACRIVGHEDIWSLGRLQGVKSALFVYGLSPRVMAILESGDARGVTARLRVPPPEVRVRGLERIAVQVRSAASGASRTLVWETDHERVWKSLRVNGVQFQTCISLWLAIHLLQHSRFGVFSGTWCASNLPIGAEDWREVQSAMAGMGMTWEEARSIPRLLALDE